MVEGCRVADLFGVLATLTHQKEHQIIWDPMHDKPRRADYLRHLTPS